MFLGALSQSSIGFGYAIIAMSIIPFFMPVKTAAIVILGPAMFSMAALAFRLRHHINYRMFLLPLPAIIAGRTLGIFSLQYLEDQVVRLFLGGILIILSLYFFFLHDRIHLKANLATASGAGLLSGFFGGLANMSGPPLVIYYISALKTKEEYLSTLQISFFTGAVYTMATHVFYGNVTPPVMRYWVAGLAGTALGSYLGFKIFKRIERRVIIKGIYAFMAVSGAFMIFMR